VNKIQTVFYFGKSLQAGAMAVVALALVVGLKEEAMTKELTMLGIGSGLFVLGRFVENLASRARGG
jgi:hypothetical protein